MSTTTTASEAQPAVPPKRGNQSGDAARQRAMEAALEAIAELGADQVRMVDIAERAGMSTGHILYHFGRKERLLVEVLRWSEDDLLARLTEELGRMRSPVRKLEHFVESYLPGGTDTRRWALWMQVAARPPQDLESRELLDGILQAWEGLLTEIVVDGQAKGDFRTVDVTEFVRRSRATLDGLALDIMGGSLRTDDESARALAGQAMKRELVGP